MLVQGGQRSSLALESLRSVVTGAPSFQDPVVAPYGHIRYVPGLRQLLHRGTQAVVALKRWQAIRRAGRIAVFFPTVVPDDDRRIEEGGVFLAERHDLFGRPKFAERV